MTCICSIMIHTDISDPWLLTYKIKRILLFLLIVKCSWNYGAILINVSNVPFSNLKEVYNIISSDTTRLHHVLLLFKYLRNLGLAMTDFDGSLGSPGPPLFTAITRNSYSSPSVRFGTVPLVWFPGTSAAFSHGLLARI